MLKKALLALLTLGCGLPAVAEEPAFRVLVISTRAADHAAMIEAAGPALTEMAARNGFGIDFTRDVTRIDDTFLSRYQVLVQLHIAPFEIPMARHAAIERFVEEGKGWVGIHAAGLTGRQFQDPQTPYWQWFETFFGGVVYSPHPAFQKATVVVEDRSHPATKNLPARFEISDEWYEFDRSPRPNVRVLASVDEGTYRQKRAMGDHPVVWSSPRYPNMIYIGVGHAPEVWADPNYSALMRDSILWAGTKTRVLVLAEHDANHGAMVDAARPFIEQIARQHGFAVDSQESAERIDDAFLAPYQLILQLNLTPIGWTVAQQQAFQRFVEQGKSWIGVHHAGLSGDRVLGTGPKNWDWYQNAFLGARYSDYVTPPVPATVRVEDGTHPAMLNLPASFEFPADEWYEFDEVRQPHLRVLATVDESTYTPKHRMSHHPVVWTNDRYPRMMYIQMGHSPGIFQNAAYATLLRQAILWGIRRHP
jgi:uncharacterized protein